MTCEPIEFGPGELGFLCSTSSEECEAWLVIGETVGRHEMVVCAKDVGQCFAPSSFQCDFSIDAKTCDRFLCDRHALEVGPDRHLCPQHGTQCPSCSRHLEIAMPELREFIRDFGCLDCRWKELQ